MDIMLDIETLGRGHDAAVIALAAIRFDPYHVSTRKDPYYFVTIDESGAKKYGSTDPETIAWWNQQDPQVRELVFSGLTSPEAAYGGFKRFCEGAENVWAKSPSFDCVIMESLGERLDEAFMNDMTFPFDFRHQLDVRTVTEIAGQIRDFERPLTYIDLPPHHPLGDCIRQVAHVQLSIQALDYYRPSLWQRLFGG
jgi:exodeoxyribonuclease VIII